MFKSDESERLRIFPSRGTKPIVDLSIHNRVVPLAHLDSFHDSNAHNALLFRLHMLPPNLSTQAIPYRQPVLVLPSSPRLLLDPPSRLLRVLACLFQHADAFGNFPSCLIHAHTSGGRSQ
jgi:hypothetical protein